MIANVLDFTIVEGTTHHVNIDCFNNETQEKFSLTDYSATFILEDPTSNQLIRKNPTVADNVVTVTIDAADTVGKETLEYECRIYDNSGHVYHVCMGTINVIKANIVTLSATDT